MSGSRNEVRVRRGPTGEYEIDTGDGWQPAPEGFDPPVEIIGKAGDEVPGDWDWGLARHGRAMTRLIEQDLNAPHCPQAGLGGGPVHPAHMAEVDAANRVYEVTKPLEETSMDVETLELIDKIGLAASGHVQMRLYEVEASPQRPEPWRYFVGHYFRCLVCGFVLPAQEMRRG